MSCTGFFQGQIAVFNFWEHRNLLGMCWYSQVYLAGCRYTLRDAPRPVLQGLLLGGELVGGGCAGCHLLAGLPWHKFIVF